MGGPLRPSLTIIHRSIAPSSSRSFPAARYRLMHPPPSAARGHPPLNSRPHAHALGLYALLWCSIHRLGRPSAYRAQHVFGLFERRRLASGPPLVPASVRGHALIARPSPALRPCMSARALSSFRAQRPRLMRMITDDDAPAQNSHPPIPGFWSSSRQFENSTCASAKLKLSGEILVLSSRSHSDINSSLPVQHDRCARPPSGVERQVFVRHRPLSRRALCALFCLSVRRGRVVGRPRANNTGTSAIIILCAWHICTTDTL